MEIFQMIAGIIGVIFWMIVILLLIGGAIGLYYAPFIVACYQKKNNLAVIFIINTMFGWLGLGWIAAWVMVLWKPEPPSAAYHDFAYGIHQRPIR